MSERTERGKGAERDARRHLERNGLRFLESNYRCRWGEIDLVMKDGDTLVFVEVRYRNTERFGGAAASVDRGKQQRLCRTAANYLGRLHGRQPAVRFDVVALGPDREVEWIAAAFDANAWEK